MRLHEATTGEAIFEGRDILGMSAQEFMPYKRRIQIIFQNPYASLNPRFIVGQILTEPMEIHGIGASAQERTDLAFELLHKVGLPEVSFYKYPHEFSGGQRQRIAIARCLTLKPDILICDESVSALDVSVQAQVLNLLQDLQEEFGLSYIFISHDLAVVKYISDQVMVMNEGEIVEIANSDEIYRNPREPYTQRLLASIPKGWQGEQRRPRAIRVRVKPASIVSAPDPQRAIARYREHAADYDASALRTMPLRYRAVWNLALQPGDAVLDVACGTGLSFPLLEEAIGPAGRLVGVELSPEMAARAQARVERAGWRNAQLIVAAMEDADLAPLRAVRRRRVQLHARRAAVGRGAREHLRRVQARARASRSRVRSCCRGTSRRSMRTCAGTTRRT